MICNDNRKEDGPMDMAKVQHEWRDKKMGSSDFSEMVDLCMAVARVSSVIKHKLEGIGVECTEFEAAQFGIYMLRYPPEEEQMEST
jgi:hypothetical protein